MSQTQTFSHSWPQEATGYIRAGYRFLQLARFIECTLSAPRKPKFGMVALMTRLKPMRISLAQRRVGRTLGPEQRTFQIDLTNRSSQPLAVPMTSFQISSTLTSAAKLDAASGG
jgi:hypothetical protein